MIYLSFFDKNNRHVTFFLNQMVVGFEVYAKQELNEPVSFLKNKIVVMINTLISNHFWLFMAVPLLIWIIVSFRWNRQFSASRN